jgi:GT2 family glycosyltransferase
MSSLLASSYSCQIICIDNGSSDQTVSLIKNNFRSVHLLETKENLGFGQANNIGLKLAVQQKADYVFLLNQDAWVEPDTVAELIKAHAENPSYGILSPVHLNGQGDKMDLYFSKYLKESDINSKTISENFLQEKSSILINTNFVNAAAWLISADCLKKTGGFDPIFFHYGEDRNYMQRAKYFRFKAGIYLGTKIYHDREQRLLAKDKNTGYVIKAAWVHFLAHACDINQPYYLFFSIKRCTRHSLLLFKDFFLLNKNGIKYNYILAKKILLSFGKIKKSRKAASSGMQAPFL